MKQVFNTQQRQTWCWSLSTRLVCLGTVLVLEYAGIATASHAWLTVPASLKALVVFSTALLLLAWRRLSAEPWNDLPLQAEFAKLHVLVLALFSLLTWLLLRGEALHAAIPLFAVLLWSCLLVAVALSATAIFFPLRRLGRVSKELWPGALLAAALAWLAIDRLWFVQSSWEAPNALGRALQVGTLSCVRLVLSLFTRGIVYEPGAALVGTTTFQVKVYAPCAGLEGILLMLLLTGGWLGFWRRELRMQRALWLIPASLLVVWSLNAVRIALLIAIGAMGHPNVAVGGFHSKAGWIFFNLTAVCFVLLVQRVAWFRKAAGDPKVLAVDTETNLAAAYLLPFLSILAVSLLTGAVTSGFEWLYPLRLVVAAGVLWAFRKQYGTMDWRFDAWGPAAGVAVFGMWLAFAHFLPMREHGLQAADSIGIGLAGLAGWQRTSWLLLRTLAAVITVPIAEELAFRGYLARRFVSANVQAVPLRRLTLLSVVASSAVFGVLHGTMWMAGMIAGIVFAVLAKWRGRLGDAISAHAMANLLIAAWVLVRGDFRLW